jgi:hypothetical protein
MGIGGTGNGMENMASEESVNKHDLRMMEVNLVRINLSLLKSITKKSGLSKPRQPLLSLLGRVTSGHVFQM